MEALKLINRNFSLRLLWMARLASFTVDTLVITILILFLAEGGGSGTQVGFLLLMQTLPRLFGPFFGSLVDRYARRKLMIACEIGKIGILLALLFSLDYTPVIFTLLASATAISSIYSIAGLSALPELVSDHDLVQANALVGMGLSASLALAPAAAGQLYEVLGIRGLLVACMLVQLLSIYMLSRLPALPPQDETGMHGGYIKETWLGLRYLKLHRTARVVALGLFLTVVFAAAGGISLVFLIQDVLGASSASYGLVKSIYGMGMVFAPLLLLPLIKKVSPVLALLAGMGLMGFGNLFTGFAPIVSFVFITQAITGIGNGLLNLANDTLIQQTVPRHMLGRIFGSIYTAAHLAAAIAYIVGGPFQDLTSSRWVFITAGAGILLSTAILLALLGKKRGSAHESPGVQIKRECKQEGEYVAG
jgi:MFS family permease